MPELDLKKLGLIVIGENINTTRNLRANGPRIVTEDNNAFVRYGKPGSERRLDISASYPKDKDQVKTTKIPHVAEAVGKKDGVPGRNISNRNSGSDFCFVALFGDF